MIVLIAFIFLVLYSYISQVIGLAEITMKSSLIIGLNPALQRAITFQSSIELGSVNRASNVNVGIGGKGQDVYVAGKMMNVFTNPANKLYLAQFLGKGSEGDNLSTLLAECSENSRDDTDDMLNIRTDSRLRTCVTLIDTKSKLTTELIEPSGIVTESEVNALLNGVKSIFSSTKAHGVAIMGSMPPLTDSCPKDLYQQIIRHSCDSSSRIVLDTTTNVIEILQFIKSHDIQCPVVLKLNARELCSLTKVSSGISGSESSAATSPLVIKQCCEVLKAKLSIQSDSEGGSSQVYVAVTDGPYSAHFIDLNHRDAYYLIDLPQILHKPIINVIGAGDATAAGTMLSWSELYDLTTDDSKEASNQETALNCFRWGLSCGVASCMTNQNSVFDLDDAKYIYQHIVTRQV